jgi:hypothetical protein
MDSSVVWLIRLLAAHLVTDFVLQPGSWVQARRTNHLKAKEFWFHIALTAAFAGWFTCFDTWWVMPVIFVTHGLIDWWKSYRPEKLIYFLADQLLHVVVIGLVWIFKFPGEINLGHLLETCMVDSRMWIVGVAILFLSTPAGIFTGLLTQKFRNQIPNHVTDSLVNAGAWIGVLERLLIFFLVMISQYEAIGLLVAAKSIIRLKEGEQKMSEYVLVGTLISISMAMSVGYMVAKAIH